MLLVKQNEQTRITNMEAKVLICWSDDEDQERALRILNLQPTEYKQFNTEIFLSHIFVSHSRIRLPGPSYDIASVLL